MSESAQSARERRQARIRQGAADRLAKITGSVGRDFQTVSESRQLNPQASQGQLHEASPAVQPSSKSTGFLNPGSLSQSTNEHDDPPDVLPSDLGTPNLASSRFENDPLFRMLSQTLSQSQDGSGGPGLGGGPGGMNFPFNLSDLVAEKTGGGEASEESPAAKAQRKASQRVRVGVHFITMILVGLASSWNPYMMLSLYMAVEFVLIVAFSFTASTATTSMLNPFVVYLPGPLQRPVRILLSNRMAIRQAYRDFCVVLLVYGLIHANEGTDASSVFYRVSA